MLGRAHRSLILLLVLGGLSCADTRSAQGALPAVPTAPASNPAAWPAVVDGKYVVKTFRFRPAWVEYRDTGSRRLSFIVVFKIEDPDVPADYFMTHCRDTDLESFKQHATDREGYVTVAAYWVKPPVAQSEFRGASAWWVDGRVLLGQLQMNDDGS